MTRARRPAVRSGAVTILLAIAILLGTVLSACGSSAAEQRGTQRTCIDSKTDGGLTVSLATSPCPVMGGSSTSARITIKDATGALVKDAAVHVSTDMFSMNMHGGDQAAQAAGDGYDTKLVLGMSGNWEVTVQVQRGSDQRAQVQFTLKAK